MLVTRARQDGPPRMVSAVGVVVPAMCGISGRISRGYVAGDPDGTDTEVLTAFIEAAQALDLWAEAPFPLVA
ncbi:hypothetical protein [Microbispora sp. H10836]|uniref:hypothetical protein n=1 Tax=Microbispora sp. H10836 TaxID=2729106 RepID=UPI0014745484|nr:hypothetical protein [Microbispora sp. H10836]